MKLSAFKSIDHVLIRVKDAKPMMDLFAIRLGLPVSWPLQTNDVATYAWVTLGNTNLEFWASSNNSDLPGDDVLPLFHGLALEPTCLADSLEMLGSRSISCKAPRPYVTETADGRNVTNFTNAVVLDVSGPLLCIFFCEWGTEGTIFPWKEKMTTAQRKLKEQRQLMECAGGKLGVTGLIEVEMTSNHPEHAMARWLEISGQTSASNMLTDDVQFTLQAGAETMIKSIVIGVRSLAFARQILSDEGLLGECKENEISLRKTVCSGLHFRFRQS